MIPCCCCWPEVTAPPLMDEGIKVQTDWLHEFLMDPTSIRPAVVLRMPNFHMSSDEASKLVDYFAAASNAEFPYEYRQQQRASYLAEVSHGGDDRLSMAMNIVVNGQYCVKCHMVGDFKPQGDPYTFGPNLADVYRRLRPKFTRNWIANPVRILPYTGMPKNIPYNPTDEAQDGISEKLFPGFDEPLPMAAVSGTTPGWPSVGWEQALLERVNHPALPAVVESFVEGQHEYLIEETPQGDVRRIDEPDDERPNRQRKTGG